MGAELPAAIEVKTDVGPKFIRWYQAYCSKSLDGSEHLKNLFHIFFLQREKKVLFRATFECFLS